MMLTFMVGCGEENARGSKGRTREQLVRRPADRGGKAVRPVLDLRHARSRQHREGDDGDLPKIELLQDCAAHAGDPCPRAGRDSRSTNRQWRRRASAHAPPGRAPRRGLSRPRTNSPRASSRIVVHVPIGWAGSCCQSMRILPAPRRARLSLKAPPAHYVLREVGLIEQAGITFEDPLLGDARPAHAGSA